MNRTKSLSEIRYAPDYNAGVLGCKGYGPVGIIALIAGDEGHYIDKGIVKDSIVFVQTLYPFEKGKLSVFLSGSGQYQLSEKKMHGKYVGQVVAAFTNLAL